MELSFPDEQEELVKNTPEHREELARQLRAIFGSSRQEVVESRRERWLYNDSRRLYWTRFWAEQAEPVEPLPLLQEQVGGDVPQRKKPKESKTRPVGIVL